MMSANRIYDVGALSKRCRLLLCSGDGWDRYGSSYKALAALTGGMVQAGWTVEQAVAALTDKGNKAAQLLADAYQGRLTSQIISKHRASVRAHARHAEAVDRWASMVVVRWPHGGRYGATFRVALALANLARKSGSMSFTASNLQIGEAAGVGAVSTCWIDTKSLRAALVRLQQWGWIERRRVQQDNAFDEATKASFEYVLVDPQRLDKQLVEQQAMYVHAPTKSIGPVWTSRGIPVHRASVRWFDLLHVVFEEAALGATCSRVWALLRSTGSTRCLSDIASTLGLSRDSTNRALTRLSEARLVEQVVPRGPWQGTDRCLDEAAEELDVDDRQARRTTGNLLHRTNRINALKAGKPSSQRSTPDGRFIDRETGEISNYSSPFLHGALRAPYEGRRGPLGDDRPSVSTEGACSARGDRSPSLKLLFPHAPQTGVCPVMDLACDLVGAP